MFAAPTNANPTLELDFDTGNRSSLFPAGSYAMQIHFNNGDISQMTTVAAGMFSGVAVEGVNTTIDTDKLFMDPGNVLAYCIDILDTLESHATYDLISIEDVGVYTDPDNKVERNFDRMLQFLAAVNAVQGEKSSLSPDSKHWLRPSTPLMSGAIQLGIWESLYEKSGEDLSVSEDGNDSQRFYATVSSNDANWDVDATGLVFLNKVFDLVNDGISPVSAGDVLWAHNVGGQDLIIDPVDVPVPATGLLLLGGFGALAWRRRTDSG